MAARALAGRTPGLARVTDIRFEWSPGRGDERFTGDHSAFDVFVAYETDRGAAAFLGIEVKYHEGLTERPSSTPRFHDPISG